MAYPEKNSDVIFTNCAMSSISLLIMALTLLNYEIIMDEDIYYESYRICTYFNKKSSKKVLYLDSICNKFIFKLPKGILTYKLIIIDKETINKQFLIIDKILK